MCRFVMYLGPEITLELLVTKPKHSIVQQSTHSREREEPLNGDGFGIAWYVHDLTPEPGLFRSISPAWSNANLSHLARVTRSSCILAHVRAATPGLPVTELNCHPFTAGKLALVHNGSIASFSKVKRALQQNLSDQAFNALAGTTDSEHIFALFCDLYRESKEEDSAKRLADSLEGAIGKVIELSKAAGITEPSFLNIAVTNGTSAAVSHYVSDHSKPPASLYIHTGKQYICANGLCRMIEPDHQGAAVLVASEPLSGDPGWDPVATNTMLVISHDHQVTSRPLY